MHSFISLDFLDYWMGFCVMVGKVYQRRNRESGWAVDRAKGAASARDLQAVGVAQRTCLGVCYSFEWGRV